MNSSFENEQSSFSIMVSTDDNCDILLNGKNIGKTKEKKLRINNLLSSREYLIEGINDNNYGMIKVTPTGQFLERHIILKPKPGSILTKSKIGEFEVEIDNKIYSCPSFINKIQPGNQHIKIKYKTFEFFETLEILSGKTTEYELINETLTKKVKEKRVEKLLNLMKLPEDTISQCNLKIKSLATAIQEYRDLNTEAALEKYHQLIKKVEDFEKERKKKEISRKLVREEIKKKAKPVGFILFGVIFVVIVVIWAINMFNSIKNENAFYEKVSISKSIDELNSYVEKYGKKGKHSKDIEDRIMQLKKEKETFENALKANTIESYENYLKEYNESATYKEKALVCINKINLLNTVPQVVSEYGLVKIPKGEFFMGSPRLTKADLLNNTPQMFLSINSFYLSKHEVTFQQFDKFCIDKGIELVSDNNWGRGERPVINISYYLALDYCKWLSEKTGFHFRLPSEAEWEYSCRAGSTTRYYWGEDMNDKYCYNGKTRQGKTQRVGLLKPNNFSLYDMSGNVYEWCEDTYDTEFKIKGSSYKFPSLYKKNSSGNPVFVEWGDKRIIRGGDFRSSDFSCYSYQRNSTEPGSQLKSVGFRIAMDIPQ